MSRILNRGYIDVTGPKYGAVGDGTTDCTSAISAAIADLPTTGGVLYFPPGTYVTSGGFTLSVPCAVIGAGKGSYYGTQQLSEITCTSATAVLFTVTANVARFEHIALVNTASTTPTAGAAIFTNGTQAGQMVDYHGIFVDGFYDNVHVGVGAQWSMQFCYLKNFVRYGLYVQNTVNSDAGDWTVTGNYIEGGTRTGANSAAINYESSGGGKISDNKLLGAVKTTWGIRMNVSGSGQTLIIGNSIEQSLAEAIIIVAGWPGITIANNYLWSANGFSCVSGNTGQLFSFSGGTCFQGGVGVSVPALNLNAGLGYDIKSFAWSGFTDTTIITGGQVGLDMSRGNLQIWGANTPQQIGNGQGGDGFWFSKVTATDYVIGLNSKWNGTNHIATQAGAAELEVNSTGWKATLDTGLTPGATYTPTTRWTVDATGNASFPSYKATGTATYQIDNSPATSVDANSRVNRPTTSQNGLRFWATGATQDWALGTLSGGTDLTFQDRRNSNHAVLTLKTGASAGALTVNADGTTSHLTVLFASLPASTNGSMVYCSDAKNFVDNAAAVGSVAVSGGAGALLIRANGSWRTMN